MRIRACPDSIPGKQGESGRQSVEPHLKTMTGQQRSSTSGLPSSSGIPTARYGGQLYGTGPGQVQLSTAVPLLVQAAENDSASYTRWKSFRLRSRHFGKNGSSLTGLPVIASIAVVRRAQRFAGPIDFRNTPRLATFASRPRPEQIQQWAFHLCLCDRSLPVAGRCIVLANVTPPPAMPRGNCRRCTWCGSIPVVQRRRSCVRRIGTRRRTSTSIRLE